MKGKMKKTQNQKWKQFKSGITMCSFVLLFTACFFTLDTKAAGAIKIDGYFDDWQGVPKTVITYYSNNTLCKNYAALVRDDAYLYFYVEMNELYNSPIPIDAYYLEVNGKTLPFFLRYPTADKSNIDWGKNVNLSKNGIVKGLGAFTYYPAYCRGDAAVCVSDGKPNDRMEVAMKISEVEKLLGLSQGTISTGAKVTITMPNVGQGGVTLVGTPTGTWVSLALMLLLAVIGFFAWRKRGNAA